MAGGDIVHETYLETWDEGIVSTLFFTIYMILFFTAIMNILVAVMMEGYDRGVARKTIDNDDPFPTGKNLGGGLARSNTVLALGDDEEEEEKNKSGDSGYNLKAKIEKQLQKSDTSSMKSKFLGLIIC